MRAYSSLGLSRPPLVASLPPAPADGDEVYYLADAGAGVVWHLRYRAASGSAHKWEAVGPTALTAAIATVEVTTVVGSFHDLATVGPTVTVPLAGDYWIAPSAYAESQTAALVNAAMSYAIGAAAASAADQAQSQTAAQFESDSIYRRQFHAGLSAGDAIVAKYLASAGAAAFGRRRLQLWPVRVG